MIVRWKWTPAPSAITSLVLRVAGRIKRTLIADLKARGFPDQVAEIIRRRIREHGTDADGRPLPPYDDDTLAIRADLGLPTGLVDLTISGLFLDSMTGVQLPGGGIGVGFKGDHPGGIANELLGSFIIRKGRDFFGLPAADERKAKARAAEIWRGTTVPNLLKDWEG